MKVRFKKLNPNAVIPTKAHSDDAGLDLTAITREYINNNRCWEYGTGLSIEIPKGHVGLIFPRSSISKTDLRLCNAVAVIDSGFLGEIKLRYKTPYVDMTYCELYDIFQRIAQLIIVPIPDIELEEVKDLSTTSDRGSNGFGSSGH